MCVTLDEGTRRQRDNDASLLRDEESRNEVEFQEKMFLVVFNY